MAAGRQAYIQSDPCSAKLPVVQAGLIRPLLGYAENRGADTQALLHAAHLPVDLKTQPQHFVPAAGWFDLFSKLVRLSGQPDLGWRVATDSGLTAYSREFMAGISSAPTLLEAWRFVARAQSRHCNCQFFTVRVIGEFGYVMQGDTCLYPGYEQRNAFRTANTIAVARAFLGDDWHPELIPSPRLLSMRFPSTISPVPELSAEDTTAPFAFREASLSLRPNSSSTAPTPVAAARRATHRVRSDMC